MKTTAALLIQVFLSACMLLTTSQAAQAAEPLVTFTESRGCRILGSASSVARLKEIAAQGTVTWDGKCVNGLIDGQGALRHQGVVRENERTRRYAFYLTGTAAAGKRQGTWLRENFNMFEDSTKYWTSLATIIYVDGISRGSPKLVTVRSDADFTPTFRQLLAETERQLAAAQTGADQPSASRPATAAIPPPAPAARPPPASGAPVLALSPPASPALPAPPVALAPPPATAAAAPPAARESPASSASTSAPAPLAPATSASAAGVKGAPAQAATQNQQAAPAPSATRAAARGGDSTQAPVASSAFQGRGLQPQGETGLRLGPGAISAVQQQILEQTSACYVDEINDTIVSGEPIVAPAANPLRISGWAADPRAPRIPEHAWIRLFDRGGGPGLLIEMPRNTERPDVAKALGDTVYAKAGFRLTLAAGKLAPGEYTVAIVQQLGGDLAVCTAVGRLSLK